MVKQPLRRRLCLGLFCCLTSMAPCTLADEQPAVARWDVTSRLDAIEREVEQLNKSGQAELAAQIAPELARLRAAANNEQVEYETTPSDQPEAHLVYLAAGVKGAPDYDPRTGRMVGSRQTGWAEVHVSYAAHPVLLVLAGYWEIEWRVTLAPDVRLVGVLVTGYMEQRLSGIPDNVPVYYRVGDAYHYTYVTNVSFSGARAEALDAKQAERRREAELDATAKVCFHSGLDLRTIIGHKSYVAPPIVVGPENKVWRDQQLLGDVKSLWQRARAPEVKRQREKLLNARFRGTWVGTVAKTHPTEMAISLADFTMRGPLVPTMQPLPPVDAMPERVFEVPSEGVTFALNHLGRLAIVEATNKQYPLVPTGQSLSLSRFHLETVAVDTKRNRLVFTAWLGRRAILSFDLATTQWVRLASFDRPLYALTFVPEDDTLYGLTRIGNDGPTNQLVKINSEGREIGSLELSRPLYVHSIIPEDHHDQGPNMYAVAGMLVISTPSILHYDGERRSYLHAIDRETGDVIYSGIASPHNDLGPVDFTVHELKSVAHWDTPPLKEF